MRSKLIGLICLVVGVLAVSQALAEVVLLADFNDSAVQGAGGVTEANLDAGTTGGSWTINEVRSSQVFQESGNAANKALALDRDSSIAADYDFGLALDSAAALDGTDMTFSFDWEIIRTSSSAERKKNYFTAYDSSGDEVFQLIFTTDGSGGPSTLGRLKYMDASGNEQTLIENLPGIASNPSNFDPSNFTHIELVLRETDMDIIVNDVTLVSAAAYRVTGVADIVRFRTFGNTGEAGAWLDNVELDRATDPNVDTEPDGLMDAWEIKHFGNLDQTGTDNPDVDGLDNVAEQTHGTDPNEADSDFDGLNDDVEVAGPTDPLNPDYDDDGLLDGAETGGGTYAGPNDTGTNPLLADSDDDGINDDVEISLGYDPSDISHVPDFSEKPNMIFIMVDDLDIREIGVYGQATLKTPRVDAMAAQGMMFTDYYTANPVCQPSRSSLMTGQDSRRCQDKHNASGGDGYQQPLHPSRVTIAEVLKPAGYTTGCVGKWGIGGPTSGGAPWDQGFDFFCGYLGQVQAHRFFPKYLWKNDQKIYLNQALATSEGGSLYIPGANNPNVITHDWDDAFGNVCSHDVAVAEGLQFIEDNADKPFFLYCAWTPPHAYMYPAATVDALTDADGLVYDAYDLDQTLVNTMYPDAPFGVDDNGDPDFNSHCYASMVSAVDRDTGRIMDKLVELGIDHKTLVIFTSDNGEDEPTFLTAEHLKPGYYNLRGAKKDNYEGGIREPFVAWWPNTIPAGSTSGVVGTFADMLPTFAEMAGISTPPQITGRSILPALHGGSEADLESRNYHYWSFTESSNGLNRRWRAVRQGDWKIVRDRVNDGSPPTYELFNLASDLYETTDLSSTETDLLARLIPLVEGTHEETIAAYFKADDVFFTKTSLTAAAYLFGTADGAGANNGYKLTPSGTGSGFNYLPFETGLAAATRFDWKLDFISSSAASFLLGGANDVSQCLAVRIDAASLQVSVSYSGISTMPMKLSAEDFVDNQANCELEIDPATGSGRVIIGSTILPFDFSTDFGPLRFWGYEVESSAVRASRPRWRMMSSDGGVQQLVAGEGILSADYTVPAAHGDEDVVLQYSTDLKEWIDNPPGIMDLRSTGSQGERKGTWTLPADSLLPRNHSELFIRVQGEEGI